jgi:hypothetical protein
MAHLGITAESCSTHMQAAAELGQRADLLKVAVLLALDAQEFFV